MIFPKNQGGTEKKFQISKNNFIFVRRAPFGGGKGTGGGKGRENENPFQTRPETASFCGKVTKKIFITY